MLFCFFSIFFGSHCNQDRDQGRSLRVQLWGEICCWRARALVGKVSPETLNRIMSVCLRRMSKFRVTLPLKFFFRLNYSYKVPTESESLLVCYCSRAFITQTIFWINEVNFLGEYFFVQNFPWTWELGLNNVYLTFKLMQNFVYYLQMIDRGTEEDTSSAKVNEPLRRQINLPLNISDHSSYCDFVVELWDDSHEGSLNVGLKKKHKLVCSRPHSRANLACRVNNLSILLKLRTQSFNLLTASQNNLSISSKPETLTPARAILDRNRKPAWFHLETEDKKCARLLLVIIEVKPAVKHLSPVEREA